jgi:hypothetical protein
VDHARRPRGHRPTRLAATLAVALGVAASLGSLASAASPSGTADPASTPGSTSGSDCPSSNAPDTLTLVAGTPQTAQLGTAFAAGLQVAFANTDGCPVTTPVGGTEVTFSAPASGASGTFAGSGSAALTVGADSSGQAAATMFTANETAGSYAVTASSAYGSVSFALTNTATGIATTITPLAPTSQTATVGTGYARRLQVRLGGATGSPVAGATVTFTLGAAGGAAAGGSGAGAGAGATFYSGTTQTTETTDPAGVATSPPFTAGDTAGTFTATATSSIAPASARFRLTNRAGQPATITPGVAASESTAAGTRFAIPLAVTITDAHGNHVPGALVTFSAPEHGASGRFATRSHPTTVRVRTSAEGVAVAPAFRANDREGGYIVTARAGHARRAAFALVNEAPSPRA